MKTIVIGLGNTILRDDGVGIYVARALSERIGERADVREAELAGIDIIEMLKGYDRAYIVDSIQLDGEEAGEVFRMRPDDIRITPRLASFHDVDIVTALALGRRLQFHMPEEITIFGVQAEDTLTIGEQCTDAVQRVIPLLAEEIAGEITGAPHGRISITLAERRNKRA